MAIPPLFEFKCGYCKQKTCGVVYAHPVFKPGSASITIAPGTEVHYQGTVRCAHCLNHTFIDFIYNANIPLEEQKGAINPVTKVIALFPEYPEPKVSPNIPPEIALPFKEAQLVFHVGAFNSAVIQCRKVLELTCKHFGAVGKNLREMIDNLHHQGLIITAMRDWAHLIRTIANEGAHEATSIDEKTAKEIFDFASLLLYLLFDIPEKIKHLQTSR